MGFTPSEIDKMSLWEFMACRDGWNAAHGSEKDRIEAQEFSDESLREIGIEGF